MSQTAKQVLTVSFGASGRAEIRRAAGRRGAKFLAKYASKTVGKALARTAASPWLLAADAAELAAEAGAHAAGCDNNMTAKISKGLGLATSVGVGGAVAGPLGAASGAALWGVGEIFSFLFATRARRERAK